MTSDIFIAAVITSVLSLAVIGGVLFFRSPKEQRPILFLLLLIMLPMNPLAFYLVRVPLDGWLVSLLGKQSEQYFWIQSLYAPLTEELAKLWPLLIPLFYHRMKAIPVHRVALAIGLGFGVGEAWTVASFLAKSPEVTKYPWYLLGGYMSERMMVCVMHSAFTAAALVLIFRHKKILLGLLSCMLLHFLGNFPIFLSAKNVFNLGADAWKALLQVWALVYFLTLGSFLAYLAFDKKWFNILVKGKVMCPECKQIYNHPLFGINLIHKRYERCPLCKKWHLVDAFSKVDTEVH